jgi:hypothetical protein
VASSSLSGTLPDGTRMTERFVLVGDRIAELRRRASDDFPAWERLKDACDEQLRRGLPEDGRGAENFAVAYLIGGEEEHGRAAVAQAKRLLARDLRFDSYLEFGNLLRGVAVVRDHCAPLLDDGERAAFEAYLAASCEELWFANRGSGWGLDDPGNNYHMAFLEGTAYAAVTLRKYGHAASERLWSVWRDKLERPGGVLGYLEERGVGGDWSEGTNYGQRAKQRLASALLAVASMGGPEPARRLRFFRDAVRFAVHQVQPDARSLLPTGDLARDSAMLASPYDRDYVQAFAYLSADEDTQRRARFFLERAAPSYAFGGLRWTEGLYKDVLFDVDAPPRAPGADERLFLSPGTGTLLARSDWTPRATSLAIVASPIVDQSHQHVDVGSFTLWKGGWQAVDAATFSHTGGLWHASAHNMIDVKGHQRRPATVPGLTRLSHRGGVLHARVDADGLHRARVNRRERILAPRLRREFVYLEPDTLVVADEVTTEEPFDWRLHVPSRPREVAPGRFESVHEDGGLTLAVLVGGAARVVSDDDLEEGGSRSFRVQVEPAEGAQRGRFLAVIRVGLGGAPRLDARVLDDTGALTVLGLEDTVVAVPQRRGSPLRGASYPIAGSRRRHVLVGLGAGERARLDPATGRVAVDFVGGEGSDSDADLQLLAP